MLYTNTFEIEKGCLDNAGFASSEIKKELKRRQYPKGFIRRISVASYEAEINIVIHSYGGFLYAIIGEDYVELLFKDTGPGIENVEAAMQKGFSTASEYARLNGFGAGMGLPNMKEASDQFIVESNPSGTKIVMRFNIKEGDY